MHNKASTDLGKRRDRLTHERVHDPYKTPQKLPEPTVCPECGSVFRQGRWQWITPLPADAHQTLCQACHRIRDNYPAGVVTLRGKFVGKHRQELIQLARNREAEEKGEHPLHRIMKIVEEPDTIVISTTDIYLPHRIAEGLRHAYHGELKVDYDKEGYFARIEWRSKP